MKIKYWLAVAVLTITFFAANSFAGSYSTLNFIGFSKDGRYLAYEEYAIQDGSGFPYASIYFIDTAKNAYAAPRVNVVIENEMGTEQSARSRVAILAAKNLKKFRIIKGNKGNHVLSHLINDLTLDGKTDGSYSVRFAEVIASMYKKGDYELLLNPIKITTKDCEVYSYDHFMLELKLTNKDENTSKFLQKDTTLPKGRGCALGYRIQDVYLYNHEATNTDYVTVFVNVYTPGFEGPDMSFMAVTGTLR